jgi:hypothetical protein
MKFLLKIGLGTNDLNLIIQLCAKAFFFLIFVLESYSKICVCNAFCHFYHVTLDETKLALPYARCAGTCAACEEWGGKICEIAAVGIWKTTRTCAIL